MKHLKNRLCYLLRQDDSGGRKMPGESGDIQSGQSDEEIKMIVLFNKPYQVLSQFTSEGSDKVNLSAYIDIPHVYAAGRLDYDSEGLLVLTDDGRLQQHIANPATKKEKEYWVQVEGEPEEAELEPLRRGIKLKDGLTRPAKVERIPAPEVWRRDPPIRYRAEKPTSWIAITITEGRNRQVRRMTAAIGFPTLRLIRYRVGAWSIDGIANGEYRAFPFCFSEMSGA